MIEAEDRNITRAARLSTKRHRFAARSPKVKLTGFCGALQADRGRRPADGGDSAVAHAAGVLATNAALVVIGARIAAIDVAVLLDAFLHLDNAHAVAARALYPFHHYGHGLTPGSLLMSSSDSCGSIRCSIILVSISRTWQSGML
jgi:hypothetical protein